MTQNTSQRISVEQAHDADPNLEALRERAARMVDSRLSEGVFRVDRSIYTDEELHELEVKNIFEKDWVFLCHESQIPNPGDYYSTLIGRQPVLVIRDKDGTINAFINACAHRGALLTERRQGNATTLRCRFHGWCFNTQGKCVRVKNEKTGWPDGVDKSAMGLKHIGQVGSYRGFVFGSLVAEVPTLEEHLGEAKVFIDMLADQSPEGIEVIGGYSDYVIRGNWKMQAENGVDGYHVSTVHRVFADTVAQRETRQGRDGMAKTEAGRIAGIVPTGCYDLDGGHMVIWAERATPEVGPLWEAREELLTRVSEEQVNWMVGRGRNLLVFPNVLFMDQPSTQIRIFRPLSVDRTLVTVYCIAPKGESAEARTARIRKFEDFYMVTGMATPDDLAALEDCQTGARGEAARWTDVTRGLSSMIEGPDEDAKAIGLNPVSSNNDWDFETLYYSFYRKWLKQMTGKGEIN
ncbi:aromatic ring-hydroxylating oxygenase subunit alpha [Alcanivorax quisquiliarum]|uniref:Aromatic ring-hydroxylating dioxygenase subunit alpha n=1 Tax=Alcanivorax quisquiliarum TaxID=2933565 RepID=A0ABT0E930_9GAMM|nr:aromatic ring-hydroxylating dioxygenase subunit alpha [Alcanivorax quisquiliarum]MCK0538348.1 aromatic ring-hydroxylating dioxygenase subunit alpha [Alcanivorax quisquiliarum]